MSALEVKEASAMIVESRIEVAITIHNASNRTCYAYSNVRTFNWDAGSHTLKLYLTDTALSQDARNNPHLKLPHMQTSAAGEDSNIKVSLPVEFSRMATDSLRIEQVSMRTVQNVELELAFSDTPFYPKIGKEALGHQLINWVGESRIKRTIQILPSPSPN
jgi:hypothetical protein